MAHLSPRRYVFPFAIALATLPGTFQAQELTRDEQVATMTAQYTITKYYHDLDYKVAELLQMQALAVLEGFAGKDLGRGSYRSDVYKLNEWMPHYKGQIARLVAAVNREQLMGEADRHRFLEEVARFSDLVSAGNAIVDALGQGNANLANDIFHSRSLPTASGIRGSIYTLTSGADDRFKAALRNH
ncbi:hypothetical protein OEZ60_21985 [Defluviimonas sp. WL0024]|uniref:DUF4142 domain-containing protein n=1 Tax=Albidovulum salinarum TaxID=2984153 RepID=A0ABT2X9M0_9RHOB|nr:hypothetical protein [Defluviimonas sp. WL0024]MCU9850641.1 hypothetical protein [Defluviimonas sp. WL0024]